MEFLRSLLRRRFASRARVATSQSVSCFRRILHKMRYLFWLPRCWGPVTSDKMAAILVAILNFTEN